MNPKIFEAIEPVANELDFNAYVCQRIHDVVEPLITALEKERDDLQAALEKCNAKLAERKTVHEWLNSLGIPAQEDTGKHMCLLRRLAVALNIQPHGSQGETLIDKLNAKIQKLEHELESHAWEISPAMAQAKIDELNAKLEAAKSIVHSNASQPNPENHTGCDLPEELIQQCIEVIHSEQKVGVCLLQRRLRLGYARACAVIDEMERRGIVGPSKGAEPRDILID